MTRLILASQSPARTKLLSHAGIRHEVLVSDVDEDLVPDPGVAEQLGAGGGLGGKNEAGHGSSLVDGFRSGTVAVDSWGQFRLLRRDEAVAGDVKSALADLQVRITVDARQRRRQTAPGNFSAEDFVTGVAGVATNATGAPMPAGCRPFALVLR